ncbi:MAG TPA: hypothetical protein VJK66_06170 [Gaiellaceae bacterium]|nr:hypothetical protein [Gaiellaceae bacterium]
MRASGRAAPTGSLGLTVIRGDGARQELAIERPELTAWPYRPGLREIVAYGLPAAGLPDEVNEWRLRNMANLYRGARRVAAARIAGLAHVYGALWLELVRGDGTRLPYGLASLRVVTDSGVAFLVDAFQNLVELENMRFHGFGTGTTAEAASQTALVTELTTQYPTDNTRPTGSQAEAAANIFRTVGTLDPDADVAITEHGIFSQAATGGGVLLDRSVFSVINLSGAGGDTLQATYDFTINSGG